MEIIAFLLLIRGGHYLEGNFILVHRQPYNISQRIYKMKMQYLVSLSNRNEGNSEIALLLHIKDNIKVFSLSSTSAPFRLSCLTFHRPALRGKHPPSPRQPYTDDDCLLSSGPSWRSLNFLFRVKWNVLEASSPREERRGRESRSFRRMLTSYLVALETWLVLPISDEFKSSLQLSSPWNPLKGGHLDTWCLERRPTMIRWSKSWSDHY